MQIGKTKRKAEEEEKRSVHEWWSMTLVLLIISY